MNYKPINLKEDKLVAEELFENSTPYYLYEEMSIIIIVSKKPNAYFRFE
ncbi:MAG: hypothetical protein ACI959_001095 [Limisphaerales bacterium]|jgi:hypothetical protein